MSIGFERVELAGDKVRLRPIRAGDAGEVYRLVTDEAILSRLAWDGPAGEDGMAETYQRWQEDIVVIRSGE